MFCLRFGSLELVKLNSVLSEQPPSTPLELPHRYVLIIESTAESDVLTCALIGTSHKLAAYNYTSRLAL